MQRQSSARTWVVYSPAILASFIISVAGQARQATSREVFDVASVKLRQTDVRTPASLELGTGSFMAINYPLTVLVNLAYSVSSGQVEKLPSWARTARVDIRAKPSRPSSRTEMLNMLRSLLEVRFQLKVHRETRMVDVYVLALDGKIRPSPGLHPITIDCDTNTLNPDSQPGLFSRDARPSCGTRTTTRRTSRTKPQAHVEYRYAAFTLPQFATSLQGTLRRPVIDRTGLTGMYDVALTYTVYATTGVNEPRTSADLVPDIPSVRDALKDQLGLNVTSGRDLHEFLVVDSIERPTPD